MEDLEGNDIRMQLVPSFDLLVLQFLLRGKVIVRKVLLLREADIGPRSFVKIMSAFPR